MEDFKLLEHIRARWMYVHARTYTRVECGKNVMFYFASSSGSSLWKPKGKSSISFPSAQTRRSQQPYLVEPMVDIRVFCTSCSVKNNMITEIESRIREIQMFNNTFLEIVDTGNSWLPLEELSPFKSFCFSEIHQTWPNSVCCGVQKSSLLPECCAFECWKSGVILLRLGEGFQTE